MPAKRLDPLQDTQIPQGEIRETGWGARIETMLTRFSLRFFNSVQRSLVNVLAWGVTTSMEAFEAAAISVLGKGFRQRILDAIPDPEIRTMFADLFSGQSQAGAAFLGGIATSAGTQAASSFLAPIFRIMNYATDMLVHSARFDPQALFYLKRWFPELTDEARNEMLQLGWQNWQTDAWDTILQKLPGAGDLIAYMRRGGIGTGELYQELHKQGYNQDTVDKLLAATLAYPGAQDLIRFAVRDAYSEDVVQLYGYDEGFPQRFSEEMRKAGFAEGYPELYWRSHWELPSFTQVLEMFHRTRGNRMANPVDQRGIEDYLRIADLPSYWRNRLIDITYNIPTRVDIRRFLDRGIWDRDKVKQTYIASGYSDEDAEALTVVAEGESRATEKNLTEGAIHKAFTIGSFSQGQATQALLDLGYDANEAALIVSLWEYDLQHDRLKADLDKVELLFVEGEIDENGVLSELAEFSLPGEQIDFILQELRIRKRRKVVIPSAQELRDYYFKGIIDTSQLSEGLRRKNWSQEHVALELRKIDLEVQEKRTKEAEDAAKEQQRLDADKASKQWAKDRNRIDLLIAQIKLEIADIKVALPDVDDPDILAGLQERIEELKRRLLELAVEKAQVRQGLNI